MNIILLPPWVLQKSCLAWFVFNELVGIFCFHGQKILKIYLYLFLVKMKLPAKWNYSFCTSNEAALRWENLLHFHRVCALKSDLLVVLNKCNWFRKIHMLDTRDIPTLWNCFISTIWIAKCVARLAVFGEVFKWCKWHDYVRIIIFYAWLVDAWTWFNAWQTPQFRIVRGSSTCVVGNPSI